MTLCPDCPYADGSNVCPLGAKCDLVEIALTEAEETVHQAFEDIPYLKNLVPGLLNKPNVESGIAEVKR